MPFCSRGWNACHRCGGSSMPLNQSSTSTDSESNGARTVVFIGRIIVEGGMNRRRVLWISPVCPLPILSGNHYRHYYLLRSVAESHSVTLLYPSDVEGVPPSLAQMCEAVIPSPAPVAVE